MAEYYTSTKHFRKKVGKSQTVPTTDGYWYHGSGKIGGEFHPTKPNDEEHYGEYVKVVRCKDCKHFQKDECPWAATVINVNDFCSKGERREITNADSDTDTDDI